jgi:ABC-type branched-subunit amino acid transport system substrate-binding protein
VADTGSPSGFRLGIDFGTSNTVGVLRWPDGRTKPLLFDGSPLLPSAVYVDPDGPILTGRDAVHSARLQPHRFEPYPKRRVEDRTIWLGERGVPVEELVATVLRRVGAEATRVAGAVPTLVNVTHPAAWPPQRRQVLSRATVAAGLPAPMLTAEPIAAASYFVSTVGTHVPVGGYAVVYDFGAGTFDASVVRRTADGGFDVLSGEGLPDAGGLDVDAAVVAYLGRAFAARGGSEWHRLTHPENENDRRAAWQLWEDARLAKEMLSRAATTYVHVPLIDESVPVGREQIEELAKPILDRTVTATELAVTAAGITNQQLSAIFLVGGSSRIPLAATLLHRALGLAPSAIEQPELVVAEGALYLAPPTGRAAVAGSLPTSGGPSPVSGAPISGTPISGTPVSPGYTTPSSAPGLPPLMATGSFRTVPPPNQPQPTVPPPPPAPTPPPPQPPVQMPVQMPPPSAFPQQPVAQPPQPAMQQSAPPTVPMQQQQQAWPVAGRPVSSVPISVPPPAKKRGGLMAAGIGGGVLVVLLIVALIVWGVTGSPDDPNVPGGPSGGPTALAASPACGYKIAYIGVASGDGAGDGQMVRDSTKMAVDEYNDKHSGCRVTFEEYDTKLDDDTSKKVAQDLADDKKVLGAIGPIYHSEVLAAGPVLDTGGVPFISPAASDDDLAEKGWKTFHRTVPSDTNQANAGAQYLKNILKTSKTFIVYDETAWGSDSSSEVRRVLGDRSIGEIPISRTATDYSAQVKQITDAGADSVYFAGFYDDGAVFVKQLRTANPKIVVMGGSKLFSKKYIDGIGGGGDGIFITCPCIPPEQASQNFAVNYKKKFNETASYFGPEGYDGANILLAGINSGVSTRKDMLAFVAKYSGRGVSRDIKFTGDGNLDVKNLSVWSFKVTGGYVNPDQVAPTG